ncbi:hypothetical protein K6R49_003739 [Escherichia coli]|nr:hypothetical protein [Escherichia coli]MBJ0329707.1 hypothetical protein [Escherichia coli]
MNVFILESASAIKIVITDHPEYVIGKIRESVPYPFNITKQYYFKDHNLKPLLRIYRAMGLVIYRNSDYFNGQTEWSLRKDYFKSQARRLHE